MFECHLRRQYGPATSSPPLLDLFTRWFIDMKPELLMRTDSIKAETHWSYAFANAGPSLLQTWV